jgi:TusA-related sulfurtransferase
MAEGDSKERLLDVRGRACPIPIVELMRVVRAMDPGETIEVLADDRAFPADVAAWCAKTGNTLVVVEGAAGGHRAVVRKERS